ncbi:MAG: hypothetical protein DLM50_05410 [Candidatus Meridianibacter frigidus]|nr:MAG: hypothetical protein DLM50_05410 [Candidatus Eremiobacteraeota bacterium]
MIITGASSGIGRALALRATDSGFATVLVARRGALLSEVEREIHARGGLCTALELDVRDSQAASAIVATTVQRYERIDVLVNNAGIAASGDLLEQTDVQLEAQWQTHVLAPIRLIREAFAELKKTRGQVLLFGSGVARVPTPGLGAYPAVKAAVRAMATQLRRELDNAGVSVTYVDPGAVDTEFMQKAGMQGPPQRFRVSADRVARKLMHAIDARPRRINAVAWQGAVVALGDMLPAITDLVLRRNPHLAGAAKLPDPHPCHAEPVEARAMLSLSKNGVEPCPEQRRGEGHPPTLDAALEPLARRMERVKLPPDFVAGLLQPGERLELGPVAMRWAGMPNKNERAAMQEVLAALQNAGFLEEIGEETWIVLRAPQ